MQLHCKCQRLSTSQLNFSQGNLQRDAVKDKKLADLLRNSPLNSTGLSPTVQNRLIDCIEAMITRQIIRPVNSFYAIIVDGTSDVSRVEQLSVNIRFVTDNCDVEERFLGFIDLKEQDAAAIVDAIDKRLEALQLQKDFLIAQGYDGASVMSADGGVQGRIRENCPNAVYIHCFNHCLNLCTRAVIDSKHGIRELKAAYATIDAASKHFAHSAVRTQKFAELIASINAEGKDHRLKTRLKSICPTRFVESLTNIFDFVTLFDVSAQYFIDADQLVYNAMTNSMTIVALHVLQAVLGVMHGLSVVLQVRISIVKVR
jgi:hypothetical protein